MGRPTEYSQDIIDRTKLYLEIYKDLGDAIPSIAGLAFYLKINRDTIYDWKSQEDKKEFSDILADILSDQERTLINKGLKGEFNSHITKLVLGKHGYSDKQELMGKDGEKLNVGVVILPSKNEDSMETTSETNSSPSQN